MVQNHRNNRGADAADLNPDPNAIPVDTGDENNTGTEIETTPPAPIIEVSDRDNQQSQQTPDAEDDPSKDGMNTVLKSILEKLAPVLSKLTAEDCNRFVDGILEAGVNKTPNQSGDEAKRDTAPQAPDQTKDEESRDKTQDRAKDEEEEREAREKELVKRAEDSAIKRVYKDRMVKEDLYARISSLTGAFDHRAMDSNDLRQYAVKKLNIECEKGFEAPALKAYLAGAERARNDFPKPTRAMDSILGSQQNLSPSMDAYLKGN